MALLSRARVLRLVALAAVLNGIAPPGAAQGVSKEYQIKAVFLLNFLQFVQWPPGAFPGEDAPLRMAVLGDDPFGPVLDEVVRDEKVGRRPVTVERARRWQDVTNCHLLFISDSERGRLPDIMAGLRDRPILLVSDGPDFTRRGGMIRFFIDGNKVRFEINPASAQQRGLKLSAQLLSVARITGDAHRAQ